MALVLKSRVKETTSSTGTGAFTLAGAVNGFQAFSAVMSVGDITYYSVTDGTDWEIGVGTYSAENTITRTTVLESSNSNSLVDFADGEKTIFISLPATKFADVETDLEQAISDTADNQTAIANINPDPTKGTLTKTFTQNETANITLSSAVSVSPVVSPNIQRTSHHQIKNRA